MKLQIILIQIIFMEIHIFHDAHEKSEINLHHFIKLGNIFSEV